MEKTLTNFNCDVVNLQYGDVKKKVEEFTTDLNFRFINDHGIDVYNDIEGLAALIELCDLVVTIPNITIQLTGALGKKGWAIIPQVPTLPGQIIEQQAYGFPMWIFLGREKLVLGMKYYLN